MTQTKNAETDMPINAEPEFEPIDMKTWPMAQAFYYYTQMAPTSYTINVTVDVTISRNFLKKQGLKFFPAYLYMVTKAINYQPEMRVALKDGVLGHWKTLTPAYPQFHHDDKTTSLLWTEYHDDFKTFYQRYITDTATHGNSHGFLTTKGIPLANTYVISCIPWYTFNSFSLQNHGIKDYYVPSFEAGAFIESEGRVKMPLSITLHHATTDGYHIKEFLERFQGYLDHPEEWV